MKRWISIVLLATLCINLMACTQSGSGSTASSEAPAAPSGTSAADASAKAESSAEATPSAEGGYTIAVVPKAIGITYFEAARAGVERAGEELGVNAMFTGPTVADAAEQVRHIQDLISQGVDAIAVSANDADALTPVLQQARDAGIVVIDWDSPADESVVQLSCKEIDYHDFAVANWDEMVRHMGEEGKYVILTSTLTAGSCNAWIEFGTEYAAEKYPGLELVTDPVTTNENAQEAYTKTLDLITTYPDLKGIIGFSSPAPIGAGQAIEETNNNDNIALVGTCTPNDARDLIKSGAIDTGLLWDPAQLGYLTVALAKYILDGGEVKDGNVTLDGFGTVTITGKEVIMGPATLFTPDNIDDFNF